VVEAPRGLAAALAAEAAEGRCVVVDCLTLWLANLLDGAEALPPGEGASNCRPSRRSALRCSLIPGLPGRVLFVANEVGFGWCPKRPWAAFRDEAGRLNQAVAALCGEVTLVAAGLPLKLKG
jgi:adenosylcobinamide kinase/adenosylcobinamide-phosphate guanylyltransferase